MLPQLRDFLLEEIVLCLLFELAKHLKGVYHNKSRDPFKRLAKDTEISGRHL